MARIKYLTHTLTDPYIRALKAKSDMQISDGTIPGLQARYSGRTGRTSFYLCYRLRGTDKQRNLKLGQYGDFSIKEIKLRAVRFRQEVADGRDPMLEIRAKLQEKITAETKRKKVRELFAPFYEKHCLLHMRPTSSCYYDSNFRIYILPVIGDMAAADVGLPQIQEIYDNVCKERAVATADHVLVCISVFLNWCEKYEYRPINSNPCHLVQKGKKKKIHYQILDGDGYKKLFAALDKGLSFGIYAPAAFLAIKTLALTGCRHGEITNLEKDELDLENCYLRLKKRKDGFVQCSAFDCGGGNNPRGFGDLQFRPVCFPFAAEYGETDN